MDTKICTKCKQELPLEQFSWRSKAAGTKRSECKSCQNAYMRMKYQQKKEIVQQLKSTQCCAKCHENRGYMLDYHHIDPSVKEDTVARMISNNYTLDRVYAEIEKCVVLCSNCHREFHYFASQNDEFTIQDYLSDN